MSRIDYVWVSDYYDGPISGLCRYEGRQCWFRMTDENEIDQQRTCAIYRLTLPELMRIQARRIAFGLFVGWHWEYRGGKPIRAQPKPQCSWKWFYRYIGPRLRREPVGIAVGTYRS